MMTILNKEIKMTMANRKGLSKLGSMYCEYPFYIHLKKYLLPQNIKNIQNSLFELCI